MHPDIEEEMYVRIAVGEFTGLYGWVKAHVYDGERCYIAIGDSRYKPCRYQWFDVDDVVFTDENEQATNVGRRRSVAGRMRRRAIEASRA